MSVYHFLNDFCLPLFPVVHLVHVNHHQPTKQLVVRKCCSIRPQTISISSISNTCSTRAPTWTCHTIRSFIIKCKDLLWMVASKCRRYNLSYFPTVINTLHMFQIACVTHFSPTIWSQRNYFKGHKRKFHFTFSHCDSFLSHSWQ